MGALQPLRLYQNYSWILYHGGPQKFFAASHPSREG
jgi:hypothetical protein